MTSLESSIQRERLVGEKYRLGPVIGTGGIATVYRATHIWTEREVAVKVLDPTLPHFEQLRAGFLREARATVQLNHPNVVDVLDMGEDDWNTAYLVMELIHGPTLRDLLLEHGKLSEEETLAILLPLIDALEKAHELGIVHRDFKPENIMLALNPEGAATPKLLDFGTAEILRNAQTRSLSMTRGVIMGTPQYMSPEQARDQRELIGPQTDVWGAGVVWYECLTGHAPFDGESPLDVLHAVCEAPIDLDALPEAYVPLLRDALHRSPALRISSLSELKTRVERMGIARDFISTAPASLSSFPAPSGEDRITQQTLAGLGPNEFQPRSATGARLDSELIRLPLRSNRKLFLVGLGLLMLLALSAWWSVREPLQGPEQHTGAVTAERDPAF
ncbi:MAG: serine/threonine protein kinase [Myxococcales bacterium]|nr:serine/threonine protein kinase [Myxococcales bacterium]